MEVLFRQFTGELALPGCERCGDGYGLSITVYFPGAIDDVRDGLGVSTGDGGADQERFVERLAASLETGAAPCCVRLGFEVRYLPRRSAKANAEIFAAMINGIAQSYAALPGVRTIHIHLIGFSAGGQVALNVASLLQPDVLRTPAPWCGLPAEAFPPLVPATVDVVTVATPLGSSQNLAVYVVSEIGGFFAFLGRTLAKVFSPDSVFNASIGEDDYGDPVPARLCRYVAIVTDDDFDESPGAQEDPCDDERRLGGWSPTTLSMSRADVVGIQQPTGADPIEPRHTSAPLAALELYPALVAPGCDCIPDSGASASGGWRARPCR